MMSSNIRCSFSAVEPSHLERTVLGQMETSHLLIVAEPLGKVKSLLGISLERAFVNDLSKIENNSRSTLCDLGR